MVVFFSWVGGGWEERILCKFFLLQEHLSLYSLVCTYCTNSRSWGL